MLEIQALSKSFDRPLLETAAMQIEPGEGAILAGPNGAGKSTLLKMIAGLITQDSGEIRWNGKAASGQRQRLAYCPASSSGFYRRLSARQNLHFFGSLYGLSAKDVDRSIARLDLFDIDYWETPSEALSDGMLQKVKILRAFLHDPEFVALDEPLNCLDATAGESFLSWLERWRTGPGRRAYLMAQHAGAPRGTGWTIRNRTLERQ